MPLEPHGLAGAWLVPDARMERATMRLIILAGEADNDGTEGLAHYVEHLAWLNAIGRDTSGFERHSNASTSATLTTYWLSGAVDDLAGITETLAGVFSPFSLDEKFMLEERDVVLREYDLRIKENPYSPLLRALDRRLYGASPLGRSVIGTPEDIARFSLAEARELHARTHRMENAVVVFSGNITPQDANAALAEAFAGQTGEGGMRPRAYAVGAPIRDVRTVAAPGLTQPELFYRKVVELEQPADIVELGIVARLLGRILDSGLPGGIARPLRYDAFIAREFGIGIEALDARHVTLSLYATPDSGVSLDTLLETFETELARTAAAGIPAESLARIRKRELDAIRSQPDTAQYVLGNALGRIDMCREPVDLATILTELEGIELSRIDRLLSALAGPGRVAATLATP